MSLNNFAFVLVANHHATATKGKSARGEIKVTATARILIPDDNKHWKHYARKPTISSSVIRKKKKQRKKRRFKKVYQKVKIFEHFGTGKLVRKIGFFTNRAFEKSGV